MTGDMPGAGGDFLTQLLGDLVSLMGTSGGTERRDLARRFAQGVASGNQPEANVDPVERISLEELLRVAEMHVADLTGSAPAAAGQLLAVDAVSPGAWALRTVDDWTFLLDAMTMTPAVGSDTPDFGDGLGDGSEEAGAEMLAKLVSGMAPMFAALQLGSAVGHLARNTLGQYEIPLWRPSPQLLVVPGNLRRFAEEWSLDAEEVSLWVCLREVTMHGVLSRPHVHDRVTALVTDVVGGMTLEAAGVMEQMGSLDPSDPQSLERLLGDPDTMLAAASPARLRAAEQLSAVVSALLGYVEHVLDGTATRLLGGRGALAEAWRRRQVARESSARAAEVLFGLDLGPEAVDRGVDFVSGVLSRAGEDGLARLWESAATLPTPAELDAPGLWLERISFEELPPG